MLHLVDTHLHLDDGAFERDREAALDRARAAGVSGLVTVGTSVESSRRAIELAERHADVYATVGIHPHDAGSVTPAGLEQLEALAFHPKVVAVGETGLDYFREFAPRDAQQRLFREHLERARALGLPAVIHSRDAHGDVLGILDELPPATVVMHCFSGSLGVARTCLDRGYYLGLGGPLTYRNARNALEVVRFVPEERLLLETDAPYLPPEPHRGQRNEPAYLPLIAWAAARARGVSAGRLAEATSANAARAFALPPRGAHPEASS